MLYGGLRISSPNTALLFRIAIMAVFIEDEYSTRWVG